jgi:phospholipase A-2-activating protein
MTLPTIIYIFLEQISHLIILMLSQATLVSSMNIDWDLSQAVTIDEPVRCACELDERCLVLGTHGGSMYEITLKEIPQGEVQLVPLAYRHDHDVTALLSMGDYYISGCKDSQIRIFEKATHSLVKSLQGHEKAVTSLDRCGQNHFVSGSWDGTAKVWNISTGALVATLEGHENTVCVCGLDDSDSSADVIKVATGSAGIAQSNTITNHAVRIWSIHTVTGQIQMLHKVANDHEGPIRNLCLTTDRQLASCSNDGTVKLRSVETGECLQTLTVPLQDVPMLLSVTTTSLDIVVTAAEDGHVVVFSPTTPQLLRHAASVWQVLSLSNGDIATCCQDGGLRIWTQSQDRMAPEAVRQAFAQGVAAMLQSHQRGPTPEEVQKLPRWELNGLQQGKSEGQVQLFQREGIAIAAQWSMTSQCWIEVGQVVGQPNSSESGVLDGVQYDHVLPIEVDQSGGSVAKLSIGYNVGENPFVAAQRFIDAHMLPQYHLNEIADYIQKRVGQAAPTIGATPSTATTGQPIVAYQHLPAPSYKVFDLGKTTDFSKIMDKIRQVQRLRDDQLALLQDLCDTLATINRYHASQVTAEVYDVTMIEFMLIQWPPSDAFPALDLARLAVLHPYAAKSWNWSKIIALAFQQCERDDGSKVAVPLLTLRLLCNALSTVPDEVDLEKALQLSSDYVDSSNKHVRLAVATLLMNTSLYLHMTLSAPDVSSQVVAQVSSILTSKVYEGEAVMRALLALGTLLLARTTAKGAAQSFYLGGMVEMAASPHGEKAKAIAKEVYVLLQ